MTQILQIHPENPQQRLIRHAVEAIKKGAVIAYPTDSGYALGCQIGDKTAEARIRAIRHLDESHNFTLMCRDLSELATYARVNTPVFRTLKAHTPGAYTFILAATKEVPKRLQHPKLKTIGLRIPENKITLALLAELNAPLMSVSLLLPDGEFTVADPQAIAEELKGKIELVVDGGPCMVEPTTVVDLSGESPLVIRSGKGDAAPFQ